ncbi:MAG: prepilin-type N-terminal cleavage/methylation domain-containing protein [Candidatus Uhrbacteria bacterium]
MKSRGFTLLEVLVALGITVLALNAVAAVSANVRMHSLVSQRYGAHALAAAIIAAAQTLPAERIVDQSVAEPRGIIIASGTWRPDGTIITLETLDGDGHGTLVLPGSPRSDGTMTADLVPPTSPDWTVDFFARSEDLRNNYRLRLRNDRASLIVVTQGVEGTLVSTQLSTAPTHVALTVDGTSLRATINATALVANISSGGVGWYGIRANAPFRAGALSWSDAQGSTAWSFPETNKMPPEWRILSTGYLSGATATLTIRSVPDISTTLRELTATVVWTGPRGRESQTAAAWTRYE